MSYFPTPHQLKAVHATRRLTSKTIRLFGRERAFEIDAQGFKAIKGRLYVDLKGMAGLVRNRGCEQWVIEVFHTLERKVIDRVDNEYQFRSRCNFEDNYNGYVFKQQRRRPYVRGNRPRPYEYQNDRYTVKKS